MIVNQEGLFKGQIEPHYHAFVKKFSAKFSRETLQPLLHIQLL